MSHHRSKKIRDVAKKTTILPTIPDLTKLSRDEAAALVERFTELYGPMGEYPESMMRDLRLDSPPTHALVVALTAKAVGATVDQPLMAKDAELPQQELNTINTAQRTALKTAESALRFAAKNPDAKLADPAKLMIQAIFDVVMPLPKFTNKIKNEWDNPVNSWQH